MTRSEHTTSAPLQNRVLPTGEIVAIASRGTMTGNRGILHRPDKTLGTRRWAHKAWICCEIAFRGRRRDVMGGRTWTELFFLDEAVAMAAGHRPCAYCRRPAYRAFCDAWQDATGTRMTAPLMDAALHRERLIGRDQRRDGVRFADLPDYALCLWRGLPHMILGPRLLPYTPDGYGKAIARPRHGSGPALTPPTLRACLAAGYKPRLHPSAV